jgi:hypothetical protein
MSTKLVAHEQAISKIFSDDYVFKIPSYQRPYAWTTEQAGELFDDLVSFMDAQEKSIEEMPPYFLGSIVLIKSETTPHADVIDGQQRLSTLTLLLSAIRTSNPPVAAQLTKLIYEEGSEILGTQDRFRLSIRERDSAFFQKYVQRVGGLDKLVKLEGELSDSQRNLRDNAILFQEKLKDMPETERVKLAQFIAIRCFLVAVSTPDLDSAYRIFSVLNSRGLDLSATDILKAEIIGALPENQRDAYTIKWEETEEDLGRESFGELFSHIRMVYRKAKPQGTLLAEFREHVTNTTSSVKFIDDVLLPMAEVYEQIIDANYASSKNAGLVNEALKWLNRLEFSDWIPPALAFSVRHKNDSSAMVDFFNDLERLSYFMLVDRAGINYRIDRFSRLTASIEDEKKLSDKKSVLQLTPIQQHRMYTTLTGPIYKSLQARSRSSVLLRLDSILSGGGAIYDYATVTVEHVLPQSPSEGSEWVSWFPDPAVRSELVHKLGNLALLTRKKNSSASNYKFDRKKTAYFTKGGVSPFAITTQVIQHKTWTAKIIENRQEELLKLLEDHWRLEDRSDDLDDVIWETEA